jgi:hypothetical protein
MSGAPRLARLAAFGRLWDKVKLFHPYLATRDIDWAQVATPVATVMASRHLRNAAVTFSQPCRTGCSGSAAQLKLSFSPGSGHCMTPN